jgi:hypothetical protein
MELPIKHKRGTTIPTASDLVVGEIAINTATGLCYTKTGAGNVVAIGLDVAANWGNIGGGISNQGDLQDALNLKFPKSGGSLDADAQLQLIGNNSSFLANFAPSSLWVQARDPINSVFPGGWSSQVTLAPDIHGGGVYGNKYSYSSDGNGGTVQTLNGAWYLDSTGIHFYDGTHQSTAAVTPNLSGYAQLSGALFTGRVSTVATGSAAGLKIGVSSTTPTTTVPGDIWTGANTLFFKDTSNVLREVVNSSVGNTFTASQVIATPTGSTTPALRITNLATSATAHSLVVEDGTNPDTTSFIVNNAGNVGIGKNPATWTPTQKLEVVGYATADTAPFDDQSTKLATTENVKASICGSVTSVPSSGWQVSYSTGYPNQIIKVYDNSTSGVMSVPTESHIPVGTRYTFIQTQTLAFSFAVTGGASLFSFENKFTSAGPYAICNLIKTAAYEWFLTGDLVSSPPYGTFISSQCVSDSYTGPGGTSTGDWGYEVTRANGSGGTYSTIEGSNTGGCYHPSGLTYSYSSSNIYFQGPYGDVLVGTSSYGDYADGNGGTYSSSGTSYNVGCGGTYASQSSTDGATGWPMTTEWRIDCGSNTYYTVSILASGYVMSQGCTSVLSTDALGAQWTVPVLQQQITDGAGGYYYSNFTNYNSYPNYCGYTPSGYAESYNLTGSDPYIYYSQGNFGTYGYFYYAYNWQTVYADGMGSTYTVYGTTNYHDAGYIFYTYYDDAGTRNVFYHFDGVNGYYETNDAP